VGINSNTLKLAYLLAQYLYTNKRLDLPGIGTFKLDPSVIIESENSRRQTTPEGISFESNSSILDAPELITYISAKTGKMKALAIADLESHIELAKQFLNIGRSYAFEGIGNLVKTKPGEFEFTPGTIINEKLTKEITGSEAQGLSKKETVEAKYQAFLSTPAIKSRWKKPVVALLVLCGIGFAIWGGYTISSKNAEDNETAAAENSTEQTTQYIDSSQIKKVDSVVAPKAPVSDNYKYVLEVLNANKAFKRYKQLKETRLAEIVGMETTDSVQYKLFVVYPSSTDTTKTINDLVGFLGKKVYIEHQN
jgi:hypothetical protein